MLEFHKRFKRPPSIGKPMEESHTLPEYLAMCTINTCNWDGTPLSNVIDMYEHEYGWNVTGVNLKQWLSRQCKKCQYDWSLNKLGVTR